MSLATPQAKPINTSRRLQGKDVGIPIRTLGQQYDNDLPNWWFANNPFLTMFFAGFSAKLPEGEAQFIYSIRLFQQKITDPVLQAQIRAFIGQEGHHSHEHKALNNEMVKRGFQLDKIEQFVIRMNNFQRSQSPEKQLAITVCGEHMTALLADYALHKDSTMLKDMHETARLIWAWHAIEEIEHKAVAFDVYDQVVGDRKLLNRTMVEVTVLILAINLYHAFALLPRQEILNLKMWRKSFNFLRHMIKMSSKDYMDFYKPDFHPWQHDNRDVLTAAKINYLGETP